MGGLLDVLHLEFECEGKCLSCLHMSCTAPIWPQSAAVRVECAVTRHDRSSAPTQQHQKTCAAGCSSLVPHLTGTSFPRPATRHMTRSATFSHSRAAGSE